MRSRVFLLSFLIPVAALAQVEITPQVGYRSGSLDLATGIVCVRSPCPSFAESENDLLFGLAVDVPLRAGLQFELLLNRQPTTFAFSDGPGSPPNGIAADFDITHVHAGLLKSWQLSRFEPFIVLGAGQTWFDSDLLFSGSGSGINRFSASLGAGAKIGLGSGDRFGVRFEARGYWVDMPSSQAAAAFLGKANFTQIETTTGLTFKI